MRAAGMALIAIAGLVGLSASAQANPVAPPPSAPGAPAITLVEGGCGPAYHRRNWIDQFGRPRTECLPNVAAPYPGRRCAYGWHWAEWRGPYGRLHGQCVANR
jgi:hypothetical protein